MPSVVFLVRLRTGTNAIKETMLMKCRKPWIDLGCAYGYYANNVN